jgi:hypothetical protein
MQRVSVFALCLPILEKKFPLLGFWRSFSGLGVLFLTTTAILGVSFFFLLSFAVFHGVGCI